MYRMSSDLAPYATHPDMPQFHAMVRDSAADLAAIGARARAQGLRLSFHPSQYVVLNSPDPELVRKSAADLLSQAEMLDLMELGPEAVMVIHVGGTYGDREASNARWVETFKSLPEPVRRRLVLEHDDIRFSASDILWIHEHTGVRLIFDHQHFLCLNPDGLDMGETVRRILDTWPDGVRPKIHFSSPRTELRELKRKDRKTRKVKTVHVAPIWTGHADYVHPFEFMGFMRTRGGPRLRRDDRGQGQGPGADPAPARHAALCPRRRGALRPRRRGDGAARRRGGGRHRREHGGAGAAGGRCAGRRGGLIGRRRRAPSHSVGLAAPARRVASDVVVVHLVGRAAAGADERMQPRVRHA